MSRDWSPEEIQQVSEVMKAAGHMSFEEFCKELEEKGFEEIPDRNKLPENYQQVTGK